MKVENKKCPICGERFYDFTSSETKKYCSLLCKREAKNRRARKKAEVILAEKKGCHYG